MGRILLIDDAQLARKVLRTILEDKGYEICGEAGDGKEGIEKFKQLKPDLVICDIRMNGMNGLDCLRAILAENPAANVVICTAVSDKPHIDELFEAGAKDYLEKPIQGRELLRITESLIGKPTGKQASYKEIMEKYAEAEGLARKPLLDFFEAFRKINGYDLDDPRIDAQYLRNNGESAFIGTRALISPKITMEQMRLLEDIFHRLISEA